MRKTAITSQSNPNIVTLTANVANVATPAFKAVVPRGATYRLHNTNIVRGSAVNGTYMIIDLRDNTGAKISGASRILVFTKSPAAEFPSFHRALPYSIWRDLETTQQRNEDYKATIITQADLNTGAGVEIPEGHEFHIFVESAQVVDWSKSFVQVDFEELN